PDKATLANMSPEYGATIGFFPVDASSLAYLRGTGRSEDMVQMVERISKELGLFRTDETPDPEFTSTIELDLASVEPSLAGPKRPQDRIRMGDMHKSFSKDLAGLVPSGFSLDASEGGTAVATEQRRSVTVEADGQSYEIGDGTIVIASITSCTNTSNPSVMVGAGLLAKRAVERGLDVKPWVKTALAPGSGVVTDYLTEAGLLPYLEALRFHVVGYGCMTCIGNSGPLPEAVHKAVADNGLVVASVLSGNRNFEARIHPMVRANYLASPGLVVAYAIAGRIDIDLYNEPLGHDTDGKPVFLADIWPSPQEVRETVASALKPEMFTARYDMVSTGDENWQALPLPTESSLYDWDAESTYVRNPPFFEGMTLDVPKPSDIHGARVLAMLGQSVTTDHISPAGAIPKEEPAGMYLREHGVEVKDFNTFGARRGNHEVMMRGTFGNIRMKNLLLDGKEGGYTLHFPSDEVIPIYDASMRYQKEGTSLVILAGQEYGTGSSRDWAAKGTILLGVKAVIAESFERIHRSNLVGMGVLPLEFLEGATAKSLGLSGRETFTITGVEEGLEPGCSVHVVAAAEDGTETRFEAKARLDSDVDVEYYVNGGILQTVLRKMARGEM
ncbi:MAG: aconitate hydratase AcnA, partial [Gemmatimonadetes bacterium]|nr:aconitate hydratase AcnA [Gemmatimonadota bacterium]